MDNKSIDIQISAYLKSIIESGANPSDWDKLLRDALKIHFRLRKEWLSKSNGQ